MSQAKIKAHHLKRKAVIYVRHHIFAQTGGKSINFPQTGGNSILKI